MPLAFAVAAFVVDYNLAYFGCHRLATASLCIGCPWAAVLASWVHSKDASGLTGQAAAAIAAATDELAEEACFDCRNGPTMLSVAYCNYFTPARSARPHFAAD